MNTQDFFDQIMKRRCPQHIEIYGNSLYFKLGRLIYLIGKYHESRETDKELTAALLGDTCLKEKLPIWIKEINEDNRNPQEWGLLKNPINRIFQNISKELTRSSRLEYNNLLIYDLGYRYQEYVTMSSCEPDFTEEKNQEFEIFDSNTL